MLTYLINVTGDLLAVSLIIGVTIAFIDRRCKERGRLIARIGLALGFAAAGIRAYITNTRRIVGGWRVGTYGYLTALVFFVLLAAALIVYARSFFRRDASEEKANRADTVISVLTALLISAYLYCSLPSVLIYPFKFDSGGNGILSTDYLFRLGGYLLGVITSLIAALAAYQIASVVDRKGYRKLLSFAFISLNAMYAVYDFARLMSVLTARKIIDSIPLFQFAAASNNNSQWYAYAAFLVLIALSAVIWVRSYTAKEPYETKAEHRRQRAIWRSGKRYSIPLLLCFVMAILCSTWFVKLNTVVIREAPVEEPIIIKDGTGTDLELRVPLEMVNDGHLHRFGYTTPEGNPVRFIVILKQENTTNYGIGLDACEICGEAGYYENKDGQVVCKKCGVVMNTTTIGMKGGCNPIIIDYDINEGYITVPVSEMLNNQSRFKK